ncbi:terminase small subunit-like protein [Lelliottia jeotgali]
MAKAARAKTGRPSSFNPEVAERLCMLIAQGDSVAKAAKADGMPDARTIFRWLATDDPDQSLGFEAFRQQYARAREIRADARFERLDEIMAKVEAGKIEPAAARVMLDAIKWQAGKENAKRYGDAVTLKGDKENPLQVKSARDLSDEQLAAIAAGGLRGAE